MTIDQTKDHFVELLEAAAEGEQVEIVRENGSIFARKQSKQPPGDRRGVVGSMKDEIRMADAYKDSGPLLPDEKELISMRAQPALSQSMERRFASCGTIPR